jgi:hypothetical protein
MKINLEPIKFEVNGIAPPGPTFGNIDKVLIEARDGFNGRKWAVTYRDYVLSKRGRWEYEPRPSSRTGAFLKRTRYASAKEALSTLTFYGTKQEK